MACCSSIRRSGWCSSASPTRPLIGAGHGSASTITAASPPTGCSRSRSGTRSISSSCLSSRHASGACHRARGQPPQGLDAEHRAGGLLPALHSAGVGRLSGSGAGCSTRISASRNTFIAPFTGGQRVSVFRTVPLVHAGGRLITVWWQLGFSVLLFIAGLEEHFERKSTKPPSSTAPAAGRNFRAHHLAPDLADHRARLHNSAHPAAQDLRSGLSVHSSGRTDATMVMVQYIYEQAFQLNHGRPSAAASAVALPSSSWSLSVLQYQLLRARGAK